MGRGAADSSKKTVTEAITVVEATDNAIRMAVNKRYNPSCVISLASVFTAENYSHDNGYILKFPDSK